MYVLNILYNKPVTTKYSSYSLISVFFLFGLGSSDEVLFNRLLGK